MKHKTIIFLLIGLAILAVMLYFIGIDQVIDALELANFWFILLAIIMQIFTYYLFALRWNIVNKTANINISIKNLFPMVLVGLAVNNITPSGRGGGEPVRAYILAKQSNNPSEEAFATVIADRALDTFPFLLLAIITIISMILYFSLSPLVLTILILSVMGITVALILLIYMSVNQKAGKKITKWLVKIIKFFYRKIDPEILEQKVIKAISGFQKTMKLMLKDRKILYHALPVSFLIWFTEILRVFLVFLAFGATVDPILIGEVFIVASLIGMIPLLPGGLGAVDGVMILFYSSAGISPSISAAATVIERLISFWMTTMIGLAILPHYGASVFDKINSTSISEEETVKEIIDELDYMEDKNDKKDIGDVNKENIENIEDKGDK
ncbi:UPF0104 family protein [Methanobrevibacter sp. TMH8]|uniref:UPF0104 family protein n=1 Tax=Methanobrevibacter sp. TMH8 TaxID=2848611 RepID=UPI001CCE7648|nr:UPF0104 family protein [Methanobrevibacter sp. TMH8]MBZ9570143.1 UPF0104 family protein [Methanobrevibacter sp. TMH8]